MRRRRERAPTTLPASPIFYLPLIAPWCARRACWRCCRSRVRSAGRWLLVPETAPAPRYLCRAGGHRPRARALHRRGPGRAAADGVRAAAQFAAGGPVARFAPPLDVAGGPGRIWALSRPALSPAQLDMARSLQSETVRMSALVANLLDMARIESGQVRLNLQWQALEEVVGSAAAAPAARIAAACRQTQLAPDLPLVRYDAVLVERVLCNCWKTRQVYAARQHYNGSPAGVHGQFRQVTVFDDGPGLPPGAKKPSLKNSRAASGNRTKPGAEGLAICRAIVEAHGGHHHAQPHVPGQGAAIVPSACRWARPPAARSSSSMTQRP